MAQTRSLLGYSVNNDPTDDPTETPTDDPTTPTDDPTVDPGDPDDGLAETGTNIAILSIALVSLLAGAGFVIGSSRKKKTE